MNYMGSSETFEGEERRKGCFIFVKIPGTMDPVERGKRFQDPLDRMLTEAGIGEVTGGGFWMDERGFSMASIGLDVLLRSMDDVPALTFRLIELGVPKGTVLEYHESGEGGPGPLDLSWLIPGLRDPGITVLDVHTAELL